MCLHGDNEETQSVAATQLPVPDDVQLLTQVHQVHLRQLSG